MKAEGQVDLRLLFQRAEDCFRGRREEAIRGAITHRLGERLQAAKKIERLKADLAKAEKQLTAQDEQIEKIRKGDWTALPEPKGKSEPEKGNG